MINFTIVSGIFNTYLESGAFHENDQTKLILDLITTNKTIWDLEDIARMKELGFEKIASTKSDIDRHNQIRNDLIHSIDIVISDELSNTDLQDVDKYYSESPGMLIDRLSIMFIRLRELNKILVILEDKDLEREYLEKISIVQEQINLNGIFFDKFIHKVMNKEIYFKVQKAVKVYNDARVRSYIKSLKEKEN